MIDKTKYGLLVTRPINNFKNIGDYIQSLAARQFIPSDEEIYFIDKEKVSHFASDEPIKVIMNAWYMWHPENWPPQNSIVPLMTSIHITPLTASLMLSEQGKDYMVKHGPVGCRDTGTKEILEKAGVPCYFSGCLTLTLGETYRFQGQRNGIVFASPFLPPLKYLINRKRTKYFPMNLLKGLVYYLKNIGIVNELIRRHSYFRGRFKIQTIYNASMFYHIYSSRFSNDTLLSADYVSHIIPVSSQDDDNSLLKKAELLIKMYAKAKLVVTSRIHCALPCIGLETPLIFVLSADMESDKNMFNAPNRFGGLVDFFRTMYIQNEKLSTTDEELSKYDLFDEKTSFQNKTNWKEYRDKLVSQSKRFFSE